jgi:hypothetical protein
LGLLTRESTLMCPPLSTWSIPISELPDQTRTTWFGVKPVPLTTAMLSFLLVSTMFWPVISIEWEVLFWAELVDVELFMFATLVLFVELVDV